MAIGASAASVVRLVLARVTVLAGLGIVAGCLLCFWAGHLLEAMLFNITPRDPASMLASIVALGLITICAGWLPARRASRIEPAEALREG
jgi:ABC-type antimicrobial peptide transport system permease subunit